MRVLFVCTANMSRSPSAEVVFRILARRLGVAAQVDSAGVAAPEGGRHISAMRHALAVAGYDPGDDPRSSRAVTAADIEWATDVVVMEPSHLARIVLEHGEPRRAHLFMELAGEAEENTPDPYMGQCIPDHFIRLAERACRALLDK